MRHIPKSLRNARGRPQRWHRLSARTLNFGVRFHFSTIDFFATKSLLLLARPERHVHELEQLPALFVGARGGDDRHVHAAHLGHLLEVDLGEDDLFVESRRVVATSVERARREPAEVADTRRRHVHQPVEELVHPRAAERDHAADREALAQLEVRDRLLRLADGRLLAADLGQLVRRDVDVLDVRGRVTHAHVDHDLHEARGLHDTRVSELLHEHREHLLGVMLREPRLLLGTGGPALRGVVGGRGPAAPALPTFLGRLGALALGLLLVRHVRSPGALPGEPRTPGAWDSPPKPMWVRRRAHWRAGTARDYSLERESPVARETRSRLPSFVTRTPTRTPRPALGS